jgi:hypothetical protein
VRVYRAIYLRYQQQPDRVAFTDVAVAQQNFAASLASYLSALNDMWSAVVDLANLLQTDDLYGDGSGGSCPPPVADQLLPTAAMPGDEPARWQPSRPDRVPAAGLPSAPNAAPK